MKEFLGIVLLQKRSKRFPSIDTLTEPIISTQLTSTKLDLLIRPTDLRVSPAMFTLKMIIKLFKIIIVKWIIVKVILIKKFDFKKCDFQKVVFFKLWFLKWHLQLDYQIWSSAFINKNIRSNFLIISKLYWSFHFILLISCACYVKVFQIKIWSSEDPIIMTG